MRTIGRLATRVGLCLGFLVCLTLVSAAGAGAQTGSGSGSGSGACGSGSGAACASTTTVASSTATTAAAQPSLALTGEQVAIPLLAAGGLMIVVLGTRQLRRRANN